MPYMWNDDDALTTANYRGGTLSIYSGPKRPKSRAPAYQFQFVQTDKMVSKKSKSVIAKNAKKYAGVLKSLANK